MRVAMKNLFLAITLMVSCHTTSAIYVVDVYDAVDSYGSGTNVCTYTYYQRQSYHKWGQVWKSYRRVTRYRYNCCHGWKTADKRKCDVPLCGGSPEVGIDPSPCSRNIPWGYIKQAGSDWQRQSGGYCESPDNCRNCVVGAYSTGPYCTVCPQINDCDLEICTNGRSSICQRCASDYGNCNGCKAYLNAASSCQALCSWQRLCFPGTCGNQGLDGDCKCHDDFDTPAHLDIHRCAHVATSPVINALSVKIKDKSGGLIAQNDPNSDKTAQSIWTNGKELASADVSFMAEFVPKKRLPNPKADGPSYIAEFKVGVKNVKVEYSVELQDDFEPVVHVDDGGSYLITSKDAADRKCKSMGLRLATPEELVAAYNNGLHWCACGWLSDGTARYPIQYPSSGCGSTKGVKNCGRTPWKFGFDAYCHNDWSGSYAEDIDNSQSYGQYVYGKTPNLAEDPQHLWKSYTVKVTSSSGGMMKVQDKDDNNSESPINMDGTDASVTVVFNFDRVRPLSGTPSDSFSLGNDVLTRPSNLNCVWKNWRDSLSGLKSYKIEIFALKKVGSILTEQGAPVSHKDYPNGDESATIGVDYDGMFSVLLTAYDNAGNYASARRVFYQSDPAVITKKNDTALSITGAKVVNKQPWLTDLNADINVDFKDRYINLDLVSHGWMLPVKAYPGISDDYDDHEGKRTVLSTGAHQGIQTAKVGYAINRPPTATPPITWKDSSYIIGKDQLQITGRRDGDSIDVYVKVTDFPGNELIDNVRVFIDSSAPIIDHLWLTRDGVQDLAVHSATEFTKMSFEWEAFDPDSGISTVSWTLFDNYTNIIVHGRQAVGNQGKFDDIETCKTAHTSSAHGHDCYCTPWTGCYHKDFLITPKVSEDNGLDPKLFEGKHDADYYIEIIATNWAGLEAKAVKKITIDASPPQVGHVYDSRPGFFDIDYQNDKTMYAHWEGFFDRESGIKEYQYIWGTECATKNMFGGGATASQVVRTTSRHFSYAVRGPDKYFVSVVALNRALAVSDVVCSDGVVFDTTAPVVSDIKVANSLIRPGLVRSGQVVYYVKTNGHRVLIHTKSQACIAKAPEMYVDTYPRELDKNGSIVAMPESFCDDKKPFNTTGHFVLSRDNYIALNWTGYDHESFIREYSVSLSTTKHGEDIMPNTLTGTGSGPFFKAYHPGLGEGTRFYINIRAVNMAMWSYTASHGPFVVELTSPAYSGAVTPFTYKDDLYVSWSQYGFTEGDDADPFTYEFAIGTRKGGWDVTKWRPLEFTGNCSELSPPSCTRVYAKDSAYKLRSGETYFVSVKAENYLRQAAIASTDGIRHYTDKPAAGVVMDMAPPGEGQQIQFGNAPDVDYQMSTTTISARWYGFARPYHPTTYVVSVGTTAGGDDIVSLKDVQGMTSVNLTGLSLSTFQAYYLTVKAINPFGETSVTSDGVKVLKDGASVAIKINDGVKCLKQKDCSEDSDYQFSRSTLSASWVIPDDLKEYVRNVYWGIEQQRDVIDPTKWDEFEPFLELKMAHHVIKPGLRLTSGKRYRSVVKFCSGDVCFSPVYSDGVLIEVNPPAPGNNWIISLQSDNRTMDVRFDKFEDIDIPDAYIDLARSLVDKYQWAISYDRDSGVTTTKWTDAVLKEISKSEFAMTIQLSTIPDSKICPQLLLRGFTKAGLSTTISKDILSRCEEKDANLVVYDAVGLPASAYDLGHVHITGLPVEYEENSVYSKKDQDYTRYTNILSAVWPKLRNGNFTYAVIYDRSKDKIESYGLQKSVKKFADPCSHPDVVRCEKTEKQYANVMFPADVLKHGRRYYFCITAPAVTFNYEGWSETIPAVEACSDGIKVDLTPPTIGKVWIGFNRTIDYVTTHTELYINWEHFTDTDEENAAKHHNGIQYYEYAIGSHYGETDIVDFTNVGITNHVRVHKLNLQEGHTYFATVRGTDFVGLTAQKTAEGVAIDTSPPATTDAAIKHPASYITSTKAISASWDDIFTDDQSGVTVYQWAVGSRDGYADIMPYTVTSQEFGETSEDIDLKLQEGHSYYISVKAFNGAGLSTLIYSWAMTVDASPPVTGQVYDGKRKDATAVKMDQDYQTTGDHIWAFWDEFEDPHSGIVSYTWSVGSCVGCADVFTDRFVGALTDAAASDLTLRPGLTYYVTVTACNGAGMCSSTSSDGIIVDVTPPIPGIVSDGVEPVDIDYQATRNFIGAKWWGFAEPESGILHYSWWVGVTKGGSEILPSTVLHQNEMAYLVSMPGNVPLPVGRKIYITVSATNYAGLSSQATSNGFMIDSTPPVFTEKPNIVNDIGVFGPITQVVSTMISVEWTVSEEESYIEETYVSLTASSYQGDKELSSATVRLEGAHPGQYTFTNLKMQDGSYYYVTVKSCNAAKMCAVNTSIGSMVDTSPPTTGTFAINTTSAANLPRQPKGGPATMTWTADSLTLAWVGFADLHSGIDGYEIFVGTYFEYSDIAREAFEHKKKTNEASVFETDEGDLQIRKLQTSERMQANLEIYVMIRAVNRAGLRTYPLNKKFRLLDGGSMLLLRRCEPETCHGHCTCAMEDRKCVPKMSCEDLDPSTFQVMLLDMRTTRGDNINPEKIEDKDFTPARNMLAAMWRVNMASEVTPARYDWSIGLAGKDEPTGVFLGSEIIWHDVGQYPLAIHTFSYQARQRFFSYGVKYAFFLRVWRDSTSYATYRSDGITIDDTPPQLGKQMAAEVKDCNMTVGVNTDVDFLSRGDSYCLSWEGRFHELDDAMVGFMVGMGSYPGGVNVMNPMRLPVDKSNYQQEKIHMVSGQRYYGVVGAMNKAGLSAVQYTDGVIIDSTPPVAGDVFDGFGLHDQEYQNVTGTIGAHWNGFVDLESFVDHYFWCVGLDPADPTECGVIKWINMGLKTRIRKPMPKGFKLMQKFYNKVYAVDAAGWHSAVIISDGVFIDQSPPKAVSKLQFGENQLKNPSFEDDAAGSVGVPKHWTSSSGAVSAVYQDIRLAKGGAQFLVLFGDMSQKLEELVVGEKYRVLLYASHIYSSSSHSPSLTKQAKISLPDGSEYVFELERRASRLDQSTNQKSTNWRKFVFYFVASSNIGTLTVSTVGEINGVIFDDFTVEQVMPGDRSRSDGFLWKNFTTPIHAHAIFSHDWNYVHLAWDFEDRESPIVDYTWALGNSRGKSNMMPYTSVGKNTVAQTSNLNLKDASAIYATIIATNAAGLKTSLLSDAINLDLTIPVIDYVYDGDEDKDIDYQKGYVIKAHWKCHDQESAIQRCSYGIGSEPGASNIKSLTPAGPGRRSLSVTLKPPLDASKFYVTIRCWNLAGESSTQTSDGVTIITAPPKADGTVSILTSSVSEYALRGYQSQLDQLQMKISGFSDPFGVTVYKVKITGANIWYTEYQEMQSFGRNEIYVSATGLEMKPGQYSVKAKAENVVGYVSDVVETHFKIDDSHPGYRNGSGGLQKYSMFSADNTSNLVLNWGEAFTSRDDTITYSNNPLGLVYEVSIGTTRGGADILQWQETNHQGLTVKIPKSAEKDMFMTVTAIAPDGLSLTKTFLLPASHF